MPKHHYFTSVTCVVKIRNHLSVMLKNISICPNNSEKASADATFSNRCFQGIQER